MTTWDVFVAHAGADKPRAKQLYDALKRRGLRPFLDAEDVLPGDLWDEVIADAQDTARVTVVLLSNAIDAAYYLQEEIARGIALARDPHWEHRVVPVWLDGFPSDPRKVPYGLRRLNGIDATQAGWPEGVADALQRTLGKLPAGPPPPPKVSPTPLGAAPVERIPLYEALCRGKPPTLAGVRFRLGAPAADLLPDTVPLKLRVVDLIEWVEHHAPGGLADLEAALRAEAPGLLR